MTEPRDQLLGREIIVRFEGLTALDQLNVELAPAEILGLIGPNGAGKTTLVNVLTGFQRPTAGSIRIGRRDMTGCAPRHFAQAGIGRTFQNVRLFKDMTVLENLEVAAVAKGASRRAAAADATDLLSWIGLERRAAVAAGNLSYGEERIVGIVRSLMGRPRYLLLDEPAAGLNENEARELVHIIAQVPKRFGCGVMLIEHNMQVVMGVCERIHVIGNGLTLANGTPRETQVNRTVIEAYLGTRVATH
jgi:branched-chain amino acid transport system ATP-binding protein